MPIREELTEQQKVQNQITAMGHSVDLINQLAQGDDHSENTHNTIDRNVRHLEIMLEKDHIKNSGSNLTVFETAINSGRTFIAAGISTT